MNEAPTPLTDEAWDIAAKDTVPAFEIALKIREKSRQLERELAEACKISMENHQWAVRVEHDLEEAKGKNIKLECELKECANVRDSWCEEYRKVRDERDKLRAENERLKSMIAAYHKERQELRDALSIPQMQDFENEPKLVDAARKLRSENKILKEELMIEGHSLSDIEIVISAALKEDKPDPHAPMMAGMEICDGKRIITKEEP